MKVLVTGSNGTLGRALLPVLRGRGHDPIVYDRRLYPLSDFELANAWLLREQPNAIIHMATASAPTGVANEDHLVTVAWTENLARIAEKLRARFIFVSSVMVFSGAGENGPFHETSVPRTPHPYGVLKRAAEEMLQQRYSHTTIARIGWQIAQSVDGNQMVAHLSAQNAREGRILVNRNWKPACSFVEDSATALEMLLHREPGLFHIDSNRNWSFSDIARALDEKLQAGWNLEEEDGPHFDQRLISNSRLVQTLAHRLPVLEIFP